MRRAAWLGAGLALAAGVAAGQEPPVSVDARRVELALLATAVAEAGALDVVVDASRPRWVSVRAIGAPPTSLLEEAAWASGLSWTPGRVGVLARRAPHPPEDVSARDASPSASAARVSLRGELPLRDALERLAAQAGVPLVLDPAVGGLVAVRLRDAPWPEALAALLTAGDLRVEASPGLRLEPRAAPPEGDPAPRWARAWGAPPDAWAAWLGREAGLVLTITGVGEPVTGAFSPAPLAASLARSAADQGAALQPAGDAWTLAWATDAPRPLTVDEQAWLRLLRRQLVASAPPDRVATTLAALEATPPPPAPRATRLAGVVLRVQGALGPAPGRPAQLLVDGQVVATGEPLPQAPGWTLVDVSPDGFRVRRGAITRRLPAPSPWPTGLPY